MQNAYCSPASFVTVVLASIVVAACATPYQEMGLLGGVTAVQIDANTMRVSARGNGFSDIGSMKDYVLLKAAQETIAHGFSLFYVVDSENVTRRETFSFPEFHTAPVMGTAMTPYGPVPAFGSESYTTEHTSSSTKPGEDIVIKMEAGTKPENSPPNLYSAAEVEMYLGTRIRGSDSRAATIVTPSPSALAKSPEASIAPEEDSTLPDLFPHLRACTVEDREMAQMAKKNGYQYHSDCQ